MRTNSILMAAMAAVFAIAPSVFAGVTEIWFDDKSPSGLIHRATPDGTLLPPISSGEVDVNDLTVIGNEVWFSMGSGAIGRLDFDGVRLPGDFYSHEEIGDFALVGDEIWISDADTNGRIERWTLDHVELPPVYTTTDVGDLVVVPEPTTMSLLALGLGALFVRGRKRN